MMKDVEKLEGITAPEQKRVKLEKLIEEGYIEHAKGHNRCDNIAARLFFQHFHFFDPKRMRGGLSWLTVNDKFTSAIQRLDSTSIKTIQIPESRP